MIPTYYSRNTLSHLNLCYGNRAGHKHQPIDSNIAGLTRLSYIYVFTQFDSVLNHHGL